MARATRWAAGIAALAAAFVVASAQFVPQTVFQPGLNAGSQHVVLSVSPAQLSSLSSLSAGERTLTITGRNFPTEQPVTVTVGGVACLPVNTATLASSQPGIPSTTDIIPAPQSGLNAVAGTGQTLQCIAPALAAGEYPLVVFLGTLASNVYTITYGAPVIISVTPSSLPMAGGLLNITGTRFASGATVSVGGVPCRGADNIGNALQGSPSIVTPWVVSSQVIMCTAPPSYTQGGVNVIVTVATVGASNAVSVSYGTQPTITNIFPSVLPNAQASDVIVTGSRLSPHLKVITASDSFTSSSGICTVYNTTTARCTIQAFTATVATTGVTGGNVQRLVLGNTLSSASAGGNFPPGLLTVPATGTQPIVTGITLPNGYSAVPMNGNIALTIAGSNFQTGATVAIGATPGNTPASMLACTTTSVTASQIVCTAPSAAANAEGTRIVIVTSGSLTSAVNSASRVTYSRPVITSIPVMTTYTAAARIPANAAAQTNADLSVTINGNHFGAAFDATNALPVFTRVSTVQIIAGTGTPGGDGAPSAVTACGTWTNTQLVCTLRIAITNNDNTASSTVRGGGWSVVVRLNDQANSQSLPNGVNGLFLIGQTFYAISPLVVTGGDTVTLTGTGFATASLAATNAGTIGDQNILTATVSVVSATTLTAVLPALGGTFAANTAGLALALTNYAYVQLPDVGTIGTTPSATAARGSVETGSAATNAKVTVGPRPYITNVSPQVVLATAGQTLTITGFGFTTNHFCRVNSVNCASTTFVSSTQMTCTTAALTANDALVNVECAVTGTTNFNPAANPATLNQVRIVTGYGLNRAGGADATVATVSPTKLPLQGGSITITWGTSSLWSPDQGGNTGENLLSVTGSGVTMSATVAVGGVDVPCVGLADVRTNNRLTGYSCVAPPATGNIATAAVKLTVSGGGLAGGNGVLTAVTVVNVQYTDTADLASASITPSAIAANTATQITITGLAMPPDAYVLIGTSATNNSPCTSVVVSSSGTSLTCTTPAFATSATTNVYVGYGLTTDAQTITYGFNTPAPTITRVEPVNGLELAGGRTVTIYGTRFTSSATVTIGGNACSTTSSTLLTLNSAAAANTTVITCTAPAVTSVGSAAVVVTIGTNTATSTITYGSPVITAVWNTGSPSSSTALLPLNGNAAGGTITIQGFRFGSTPAVTVGGVACTTPSSPTQSDDSTRSPYNGVYTFTCSAPARTAGAQAVVVTVTTGSTVLTSNSDVSVIYGAPTIINIAPNQIPLGSSPIIITGTRFLGTPTINIGTVACGSINVVSPTQLICTPTAVTSAQTVNVQVTVGSGTTAETSNTRALTFGNVPILNGIQPTTLPIGGGVVAINGAFLSAVTNVTIGGAACTPLTVVTGSSTATATGSTIICTAPPRYASGGGQVQVQAFAPGTGTTTLNSNTLTVTYGAPTILTVTPPTLPLGGGTINITATNVGVGAITNITVGGVLCTSFQPTVSASIFPGVTGSFSCVAPPLAAGTRAVGLTVLTNETASNNPAVSIVYGSPNITNIFPPNLPLPGGPIQIAGSFFSAGPVVVTINGTNCVPVPPATSLIAYPNGSLIECVAPAVTGSGNAIVLVRPSNVNNNDTSTNTTTIAYDTLPIITAVVPPILPLAGGQIVISGFRFLPTANVTVGGQQCTNIQVTTPVQRTDYLGVASLTNTLNTTELTCIAPRINAGGNQLVIVGQGTSNSVGFAITYQSPIVNQLLPISMPSSGGLINITGTGFGAANLPVSVTVNGTACTNPNPAPAAPATSTLIIATANSTNVQCVAPSLGNGTFPVVVSVNAATPNLTESSSPRFVTYGLPVVVAVAPSSVPLGGTTVNVTATNVGLGLVSGQPSSQAISVAVNGQPCTAVAPANSILSGINGTDLRCVAPALRQNGSFALTVSVGTLTSVGLNVTYAAPQIASIAPTTLPNSGDVLTLTGNFFGTTAVTVTVGGQVCRPVAPATAVIPNNLGTSVSCLAPARTAGNAPVVIQVSGDNSNAVNVTYVAPTISSVAPVLLPLPGGIITLRGTFFGISAVSVTVNGTACLPTGNNTILVPVNNTLSCIAPARAYGTYNAIMSTVTGDLSNTIAVTYAPPTLSALVPAALPSAGGDLFIIGTSLGSQALNVTVGGITASPIAPATAIISPDGVSARIRVLSRSPGVYPVTVTIGDVSNAVNLALAPPSISSIVPAAVNASQATTITLNGTSFGSGFAPVQVTVNGTACAPVPPATAITPINGTVMSCVAPALPAGAYPVTVRVVNETSSPISLLYRIPTINDTSVSTIVMSLTTNSPAATAANPAVAATINSAIGANLTNSNITVLAITTNTTVGTARRSLLQSGVLSTTAITYPNAQAAAFSTATGRIATALNSGSLAAFFDPASIAILNAAGVTGARVVTSTGPIIPTPPPTDDDDDNRALRLGLGIGLGLGIPLIIAIVVVIIIVRRKKQAVAPPA